jgi:hypothetical protein
MPHPYIEVVSTQGVHPALLRSRAKCTFTYQECAAIANALVYLHSAADNGMLPGFPAGELRPLHQHIHDSCVNAALSLEAKRVDEEGGLTDD